MIDYEAAYTRWYRPLVSYARQRGQDEDVVQDVFAELLAQGAQPDHPLLFWVLQRRCLDANRRAARRAAMVALIPLDDDVTRTLATEGPDIDRIAAAELLATLPPKAQTVFRLAAMGYEQTEIAAALGTTKGAINQVAIRARREAGIGGDQDRPHCALCDAPRHAHGLCLRHYNADRYQQQRRQAAGGTP